MSLWFVVCGFKKNMFVLARGSGLILSWAATSSEATEPSGKGVSNTQQAVLFKKQRNKQNHKKTPPK